MKLISEKLVEEVLAIIADSRPCNTPFGVVFNVVQALRTLTDAPTKEKPE